ncbi:MAG TPA: response regulator transcription factor, partial [Acidimicrobiales bacterium]|nr:response regulator transcription factor [Acidimicrobiales bacterium]
GYQEGLAWASHELGSVLPAGHPEVPPLLCQSLNTHVQLGDRWRTASVLETIAARLLVSSDPPAAARLLAASAAQRRRVGAPVPPAEAPLVDGAAAALEKILSRPDLEAARAAGAALSFTEAVELGTQACQAPALGPQGAPTAAGGAPAPVTDAHRAYELTDREADVLRLVSQGLTNREIAAQLFISTGTAGVHVSNILRKLGVSSRVKAAGLARRMGLGD